MTKQQLKTATSTAWAVFFTCALILPAHAAGQPQAENSSSENTRHPPPPDQLLIGLTLSVESVVFNGVSSPAILVYPIAHYPDQSAIVLIPGHRISVRFDSSDRNVFVVDRHGNLKPTGAGQATLTVTVRRDSVWLANASAPVLVGHAP